VLLANYRSASVAVLPIGPDGRLKEASAFMQDKPTNVDPGTKPLMHAHGIMLSPDNRFAVQAETGLHEVRVYHFDSAAGSLTPDEPFITPVKPGSGPRHLMFGSSGKFLYVNNEAGSSVTVFAYGAAGGTLKEIQTISTLPQGFTGQSSTAEIQIDPAGKFLYVSNRGHDSIAIFAIDPVKGTLTPVDYVLTQGKTPRYFALDPTGAFLLAANQNSNTIVPFRVDRNTGRLTPTGQVVEDTPEPVCIVFVPAK
jgi:6-phosphogluconolactonase